MPAETPLEQARRHVVAGRRIVDDQQRLLDRLRDQDGDTALCQDLLILFTRSQAIFEEDLAALLRKNPDATRP